jgi:hypothetical protein
VIVMGAVAVWTLWAMLMPDDQVVSQQVRVALVRATQAMAPDVVVSRVVYSDGTMIAHEEERRRFTVCRLSSERADALFADLSPGRLQPSKNAFGKVPAVDVTYNVIVVLHDGRYRRVNAAALPSTEAPFRHAVQRLAALHCRNGKVWKPQATMLAFWPAPDAQPSRILDYPKEWPIPQEVKSAPAFLDGATLIAEADGELFYDVQSRVTSLNEPVQNFVRILGRPYVVRVHARFPGEDAWLRSDGE